MPSCVRLHRLLQKYLATSCYCLSLPVGLKLTSTISDILQFRNILHAIFQCLLQFSRHEMNAKTVYCVDSCFHLIFMKRKLLFCFINVLLNFPEKVGEEYISSETNNKLASVCSFLNTGIDVLISGSISYFQGSEMLFLELISYLPSFLPQLIMRCKWGCDWKMIYFPRRDLYLVKLPILFSINLDEVDNIHCSCKYVIYPAYWDHLCYCLIKLWVCE